MSGLDLSDKVKIIVVGDSGVGKTSLVYLLAQGAPVANPNWTIGCSVEVLLHDYKAGTSNANTFFIELWDIGGWSAHQKSRSVFYSSANGAILVHDVTNRKSKQNLHKWMAEVLNKGSKDNEFDPEKFAELQMPILVVGTKLDMSENLTQNAALGRSSNIAEECAADEILLDTTLAKHLAAGTSKAVKICRFFDKVIERRYYSHSTQSSLNNDRRRSPYPSYSKSLHSD